MNEEDLLSRQDCTGATVFFSAALVEERLQTLPTELWGMVRQLTLALKEPHEIWSTWEPSPDAPGSGQLFRIYLKFFQPEGLPPPAGYAATVARFGWNQRWEMSRLEVLMAPTVGAVNAEADLHRQGRRVYPEM